MVVLVAEWYPYNQHRREENMAAKIDYTICRKRPKKRRGAKR